jgi:hypothetical protein
MRWFWLFVGITLGLLMLADAARSGEPPSNDAAGTDPTVKPEELTVFVAKFAEIGPWPANVFPAYPWMKNNEWVVDADTGLKICKRTHVYIVDGETQVSPADDPEDAKTIAEAMGDGAIPLQPDATKLGVCARLAMSVPEPFPGTDWGRYKVACPERILDAKGKTVFKEPACPSDCQCINEPVDM